MHEQISSDLPVCLTEMWLKDIDGNNSYNFGFRLSFCCNRSENPFQTVYAWNSTKGGVVRSRHPRYQSAENKGQE